MGGTDPIKAAGNTLSGTRSTKRKWGGERLIFIPEAGERNVNGGSYMDNGINSIDNLFENTIRYFDNLWPKKDQKEKDRQEEKKSLWDNRAEQFNSYGTDERREKIVALLLGKNMLHKESTVLDIGCGPGKFALEFARIAKHVTGIDISPKMLAYARENVAAEGLTNTEFRQLDWETADIAELKWHKKFSLVTGIMSPAFSSRENLEKMIAASNEYGMICHFVKRQDSLEEELRKVVLGQDRFDEFGHRELYCSLNILWLYKLYPEVVYFDLEKEVVLSVEQSSQNFINKFACSTTLTEEQRAKIVKILEEKAENGLLKERTVSKVACICWRNK